MEIASSIIGASLVDQNNIQFCFIFFFIVIVIVILTLLLLLL